MAAAMNGMALHGGIIPYSGTFLVFSDYCRPVDPARRADGRARHPCHDARLDRPRRRRPDASAGRASRGAARDPEPAACSGPATRSRRSNAGSWRCEAQGHAERAGADAPEPAAAAHGLRRRATAAPPAPTRSSPADGDGARCRSSPPARKSRSRSRRASCCAGRACRRASSRCRASNCSWRRRPSSASAVIGDAPGQGRGRGRRPAGLGRHHRLRRRLRRHDRLRRQRALQGPLQAFRHYRRGGRRGGVEQARQGDTTGQPDFCGMRRAVAGRFATLYASATQMPAQRGARRTASRELKHDRPGCHQRIRPHRPQRPARHRRVRPQGHRGRRHQRSRPGRDQRASAALRLACMAASPARSRSRATPSASATARSRSPPSKDPSKLPWKDLGVDIALECTGIFTAKDKASAHLTAGAKRVLVSAPGRRRRPDRRLRRQPRQADQGPHGRLQRLLHHQLPRAGRQGAERRGRHRQGLHDHDPRLHRRPADARHHAQGSLPRAAPRRCR